MNIFVEKILIDAILKLMALLLNDIFYPPLLIVLIHTELLVFIKKNLTFVNHTY